MNLHRFIIYLMAVMGIVAGVYVPCFGHANSLSYSIIKFENDAVIYTLQVYISDLWQFVWLDDNDDGIVELTEVENNKDSIIDYLMYKVTVMNNDEMVYADIARFEPVSDPGYDTSYVIGLDVDFRFQSEETLGKVNIACTVFEEIDYLHQSFALIYKPGGTEEDVEEFIFYRDNMFEIELEPPNFLVLASSYGLTGFLRFFTGLEHLLFLVALLLLAQNLNDVLQISLAFIAAHTLAMVVGAIEIVILTPQFINTVLGLSISYVALENFFLKSADKRWVIAFIFGVIHGFALSTYLQQKGLPSQHLIVPILAFGLGLIIAETFLIFLFWNIRKAVLSRQSFVPIFIKVLSTVILLFGIGYFSEHVLHFSILDRFL